MTKSIGANPKLRLIIYVSPQKNLVIVRNGIEYGLPSQAWHKLFYEFARQY